LSASNAKKDYIDRETLTPITCEEPSKAVIHRSSMSFLTFVEKGSL